jgi:hypothetical protein
LSSCKEDKQQGAVNLLGQNGLITNDLKIEGTAE